MYELLFWKYQDGIYLNHHLVYEALVEQETVEGLEELPVQVILNRIAYFQNGKSRRKQLENTNGVGAFHINNPQSIQIDCYGTDGKTMNLLADTMEEFKCRHTTGTAAL
jgi:hypothetical protein